MRGEEDDSVCLFSILGGCCNFESYSHSIAEYLVVAADWKRQRDGGTNILLVAAMEFILAANCPEVAAHKRTLWLIRAAEAYALYAVRIGSDAEAQLSLKYLGPLREQVGDESDLETLYWAINAAMFLAEQMHDKDWLNQMNEWYEIYIKKEGLMPNPGQHEMIRRELKRLKNRCLLMPTLLAAWRGSPALALLT